LITASAIPSGKNPHPGEGSPPEGNGANFQLILEKSPALTSSVYKTMVAENLSGRNRYFPAFPAAAREKEEGQLSGAGDILLKVWLYGYRAGIRNTREREASAKRLPRESAPAPTLRVEENTRIGK
jgi:hypothetical protein